MLKYAIVVCIFFCMSVQRKVGDYHQLIFFQNSPITSFFTSLSKVNTSVDENMEYIREHLVLFDPERWIIRGLRPMDSNGQYMKNCVTASGERPTYNHANLNEDFVEELKMKWPVTNISEPEESLWETEFNTHGSCVRMNETIYFEEAVLLLRRYNVGRILTRFDIVSGHTYTLPYILNSLTKALKKGFYVKCHPDQNPKNQYLLQVQICLDRSFNNLIDCSHPGIHECDSKKLVIYS